MSSGNPKALFRKKFSGGMIVRTEGIKSPQYLQAPDTVAVRKMARAGKTFKEIQKYLGFEAKPRSYTWHWLHKRNIYNVTLDKQVHPPQSEETKAKRAASLRIWHAEHGDEKAKFYPTNKEKPVRITKPSWHESAQQDRKNGMSAKEMAAKYKVTESRIYQVTDPKWDRYETKSSSKELKGPNVSDRIFEKTTSGDPSDRRSAVRIVCSGAGCGKVAKFLRHGTVSPVHAANYFRNHGWAVGAGPRADMCPDCLAKVGRKEPKPEKQITPPVSNLQHPPHPLTTTAEYIKEMKPMDASAGKAVVEQAKVEAKAMSKKDKLIVVTKLMDVYDLDKECYKADWTDAKVAADMGCPVEWVSSVRDEDFGPAVSKEVAQRAALEDAFQKKFDEVVHQGNVIKQLSEKLETLWDAFDKRMDQFDKDYAELHSTYKALTKVPA